MFVMNIQEKLLSVNSVTLPLICLLDVSGRIIMF